MTRITPRTCLMPLTGSLLLTFSLSVGLTFRSNHHCYAGTCGEWLFPLHTRIHVIVWYFWISISVTFLAVRAFSEGLRRILCHPLTSFKIPLVGRQLAVSGALAVFWVVALYGILTGIWWGRLRDYFGERGRIDGVLQGNERLAATALTGHLSDVTMGMVLIPISRHSALASFFKLSVSSTHLFHMLTAYTLFALVLVHASLYISWVPVFNSLPQDLRFVFPVLNPTYLYHETWPGNVTSLGIWRASLIFTGICTTVIFFLIFFTTLPTIRKKHFNVFYFTHLLSIVAVIVICLHASTMLYCTAPGLAMWILDWGMRLWELRESLDSKVIALGNGWYCLSLLLPRKRLDGCACTSPLAHFYIHHSDSSMKELHPFTTITHLATQSAITPEQEHDLPIQFLFRKSGSATPTPEDPAEKGILATMLRLIKKEPREKFQWTNKLAGLADQAKSGSDSTVGSGPGSVAHSDSSPSTRTPSMVPFGDEDPYPMVDIPLRLEGPYFTPANPARYKTVICFVAGTGVSGAIAIAGAFTEMERERAARQQSCLETKSDGVVTGTPGDSPSTRIWEKCVIVWTVRAEDYVELPYLKVNPASALEVRVHLTGKDRLRLDMKETLASIRGDAGEGSTWVYLSGPTPFIEAGESACKAAEGGVDYYGARWDI
ncbi:MAG: hypothetical protein M1837_006057 [Sclerophora amabilis]|nr:MAG: hypothetical protein M1837_006057 [Sclerophora amabilis]